MKISDPMFVTALGVLGEAMSVGPSRAIERQEKDGQRSLVVNDSLPTEGLDSVRPVIEGAGGEILGVVKSDPMFTTVRLPAGWSKKPTDHSMWSDLVDDKGRKRASIFYKAAFYDRSAHISPNRCITCARDYDNKTHLVYRVLRDGAEVLHEVSRPNPGDREQYRIEDQIRVEIVAWMNEHYPQHGDPTAYWN